MRRAGLLVAGLVLALTGCEQELTVPGACPEFCPSGQPQIRDTTIAAVVGSDSSFFGYLGQADIPALLVSDGLPAGEARAWYKFPRRVDSILVQDTLRTYTIDSIVVILTLVGRDSTKGNLVFDLYRIPIATDTTVGFSELNDHLVPANWIDSLPVPDSVRTGPVRKVFTDSVLARFAVPEDDSGQVAIGVRVRGPGPTGARLGSLNSVFGSAGFTTYARVAVADTTLQRHTLALTAIDAGYVRTGAGPVNLDRLYAGDLPAGRSLIRFAVPKEILQSTLLRVTLELEPDGPLYGLPNDAGFLQARAVDKDLGAKSTPSFAFVSTGQLPEGTATGFSLDVLRLVSLWGLPDPPAQTLYLSMLPEGGSFHRPVFHSTRSGGTPPRLRITYLLPPRVERP